MACRQTPRSCVGNSRDVQSASGPDAPQQQELLDERYPPPPGALKTLEAEEHRSVGAVAPDRQLHLYRSSAPSRQGPHVPPRHVRSIPVHGHPDTSTLRATRRVVRRRTEPEDGLERKRNPSRRRYGLGGADSRFGWEWDRCGTYSARQCKPRHRRDRDCVTGRHRVDLHRRLQPSVRQRGGQQS